MLIRVGEHLDLDAGELQELAREARVSTVRLLRFGRRVGLSAEDVAQDVGLQPGTLRQWEYRWRNERLRSRRVGRPGSELQRQQRETALWALHKTGGRIGIKSLMLLVWPPAGRSALMDLKGRWRYAAHRRGGRVCGVVNWLRPGAVWAMDWTEPESVIDGMYPKVLTIRDLGSGKALVALPCPAENGDVVAGVLWGLIAKYGAPAAIKRDNGGSLGTEAVRLVAAHHGILVLTSPPGCPGYNGGCEAGIGSLKAWTHHLAAACGRSGEWTSDDLAGALSAVNASVRKNGLSADDSWSTRRPFGAREREELWARYREHEARERSLRGHGPEVQLERLEQASVDRRAIARALEEQGLVCFRRRWIRPPIRGRKLS